MRTIGSSLIRWRGCIRSVRIRLRWCSSLKAWSEDAAVGIISSDQNDVIKVLTIASVVGIPPVLVAGIYGMNFKNIPEYDWAWGYQWSLALIVITALLPLIWFKWKQWI